MSELVKSNINKYYLASALNGLSLTIPIAVLYYLSYGLSFTQVASLESIFLITMLVFEIPTGVLADRFGRKTTVALGALFMPIATLIVALGGTFSVFALTCILYGIGMALMSGAESALIYDSLTSAEEEKTFIKIEGRSSAYFYLLGAIFAPIGSWIYSINHRAPFFFDSLLLFFVFLVYFSMTEISSQKSDNKTTSYKETLIKGIKQISHNPLVLWYVIIGILLMITFTTFYNVIGQPMLIHQGLEVKNIGFVIAGAMLIQALLSEYAHKIESILGERLSILFVILVPAICFLVMGSGILFLTIMFYLIYGMGRGFIYPILGAYINRNVTSESRATALSVESFIGSLVGAIMLPVAGLIIDRVGVNRGTFLLGVFLLFFGTIVMLLHPRKNINKSLAINP